MNRNLIKVNDNYGAVSDENGEVRVVRKVNNEASFEDILTKENDLTSLRGQIYSDYHELVDNKHNMIMGEILNLSIYGGMVALYFASKGKVTPVGTAAIVGTCYAVFKGTACLMTGGTRISRFKKNKELKKDMDNLSTEIVVLKRELKEAKEKTQYEGDVSLVEEEAPYRQIVDAMYQLRKNKPDNPNILRLTK